MTTPEPTPDDDPRTRRDRIRREEGALAAFFEAGRAEPTDLPPAFLNAILADAATATRAPHRRRRPAWTEIGARVRQRGGWGQAAALAGCLAVGFLAGALGAGSDLAADALWPGVQAFETATDGLDGFFDLTAAEG